MFIQRFGISKSYSCTLSQIFHFARLLYVVAASVIVCHSIYNGYKKMKAETVLVKSEIQDFDQMRYPSITFCYKYKHGLKHATVNYFPYLYEKAKQEGTPRFIKQLNLKYYIRFSQTTFNGFWNTYLYI